MKLRKMKALIRKDMKLSLKNKNIILLLLLPLIFAVIYSQLFKGIEDHMGPLVLLSMISGLGLMVIGGSVMAMSISEEKEKKTMRSLMLSDVSGIEFIISKIIIILFLFLLVMIGCFFIVSAPLSYLPKYMLMMVLTTIALLFISSVIGLLSPSQQEAGILSTPMMLILGIPMFAQMGNNALLTTIAKFMPTGPITFIIGMDAEMGTPYSQTLGFGLMIVWIILSLLFFSFMYKKKNLDN